MKDMKRAFRTTKLRVNSLTTEAQSELEQLFISLVASKTDAVKAEREAGRAVSKAHIQRSKARTAEFEFLEAASAHFDPVASEVTWMIYRDKDGIILEGFSERLTRNYIRAQAEMIGKQLDENTGNDDSENLYETDEEDGQEPN
jgi:hypothetical protein